MTYDHSVVLTRKDGSARCFRVYGRPTPNKGDIINLPIGGHLVKARIRATNERDTVRSEVAESVDDLKAEEI
jgi:hypothetical protein